MRFIPATPQAQALHARMMLLLFTGVLVWAAWVHLVVIAVAGVPICASYWAAARNQVGYRQGLRDNGPYHLHVKVENEL